MKKFLLFIAFTIFGLGLNAQNAGNNNVYYFNHNDVMTTTYDLQSNSVIANRMYQTEDGSMAVVQTLSRETDNSFPDRGSGYNFFDGKEWDTLPEKIEANATGADIRTGWPTIAPYGKEGEILVNHGHASGLAYYTRAKAGEGKWDGPHAIPNPENLDEIVGGYGNTLAWARVATTGENNDVVHVFANVSGNTNTASYYLRTENLSDANAWKIDFAPVVMDNLHINCYEADDYSVSVNGDRIAVLYCNGFSQHVMLYESADEGLTWTSRMVWECPVDNDAWLDDNGDYTMMNLYGPTQGSVAIGADGVSHVALGVSMYSLKPDGNYSLYYGLTCDGIAYWNDTTLYKNIIDGDTVFCQSPIRSSQDYDPKNALKLWLSNYNYDKTNTCAWTQGNGFNKDFLYTGSGESAGDYLMAFSVCAYPSIAVDPAGNIAVAYSAPDVVRDLYNKSYYYRSLFVSYKAAGSDKWDITNMYQGEDYAKDECTFVSAVSTPVKENEFWFSCLSDDTPGFYSGNNTSQDKLTTGTIQVFNFKTLDNSERYVKTTINPIETGKVLGDGTYDFGQDVTITAVANEGFAFHSWTENEEIVSTDIEYSFKIETNRDLVANFVELSTPENLTATTTSTSSIIVTWKEEENATSYNVYRNGELASNLTNVIFIDNNLEPCTEYCYAVTAICNETETDKSEEVCATTLDLTISTPENLVAKAESTSSISLSWDKVENAKSYNVYREGDSIANVNTNSYLDKNLKTYTGYCYTVTAVRNETVTNKSEKACAKTLDLPINTPENLVVTPISTSSIILTWNIVENAENYNVYRDGELITNVTNPTYTDKDLEYNTEYCYTVTAVRGDEESEESDEVCVKTLGESIEELSSSFVIYPNPVENELFLATEVRVEEVSIYDIYGRQTTVYGLQTTDFVHSVNVSGLEAGVYFVKIKTDEGNIVKRFVKK